MRSVSENENYRGAGAGFLHFENTLGPTKINKETICQEVFVTFTQTPNCDELSCYSVANIFATTSFYFRRDSVGMIRCYIERQGSSPTLSKSRTTHHGKLGV